ncbi:hypothetical protein M3152_13040 [Sporosarcina luteola]|uniref:hypothetical protein n=1 Tax=Bacillales TaxID=1385 RepID=UPI00203C1793|nr:MULTISPECIES: hypothetical protein [Bacillales]MCM3638624.1 hypothetical protein [Sporosarcina luteola]
MLSNLFTKQSFIGYLIKIAGVVVIAWGVIQGIISLSMMAKMGGGEFMNEWGEMQYASGLTGSTLFAFLGIVAIHFLIGLLIIGFGEVIDTLQKIYFCMDSEAKQQWEDERKEKEKEIVVPNRDVPFWVEQEVKGYYEEMQSNVQSIEKTSDPYVFKIAVDERVDYMEVGNFEPRILSEEETAKFTE